MADKGQILDSPPGKVLMYDQLHDLGDAIDEDFSRVMDSLGDLYAYLDLAEVKISGTLKQSAATAVLTSEQIRGIMSQAKLKMNGHVFFEAMTGNSLYAQQRLDGWFDATNDSGQVDEDFANDQDDHDLDIRYRIPGGRNPLRMFGRRGQIKFVLRNSGWGDWGVKSGTQLRVRIFAHVHYDQRLLLPRPYRFERFTSDRDPLETDPDLGKCDLAFLTDGDTEVPGSYTRGTSDVIIRADDRHLIEGMTTAEAQYAQLAGRWEDPDDWFDQGIFIMVHPRGVQRQTMLYPNRDMIEFPYKESLIIRGAGDGGDMACNTRTWLNPGERLMRLWAGAHKVAWGPEAKGRLRIDGAPVGTGPTAGLTSYQIAGMQRALA